MPDDFAYDANGALATEIRAKDPLVLNTSVAFILAEVRIDVYFA